MVGDADPYTEGALSRLWQRYPFAYCELVKWPWVTQAGGESSYHEYDVLRWLGNLYAPDEDIAIAMVRLPFLETLEWGDADLLEFLVSISESDPVGLAQLLTRESLTESDDTPAQILYLESKNPGAATKVAAMEWVRDGIYFRDNATLNYLQETAIAAPQFFNFLVEEERTYIPAQNGLDESALYRLVEWSNFDEETVLRLVNMPFMERIEIQDGQAVTWLYELAKADYQALQRILSRPIVQDGVTDEESIYLSLYYLEETLPEAAAAIFGLPWVADGIDHVPWQPRVSSIDVLQEIEAHEIIGLVRLAIASPDFLIELTKKGWMRDSINRDEATTIGSFGNIIDFDEEAALRVLRLPQLDNHDRRASRAVDRLFSATFEGREAFDSVLEELEAGGGS